MNCSYFSVTLTELTVRCLREPRVSLRSTPGYILQPFKVWVIANISIRTNYNTNEKNNMILTMMWIEKEKLIHEK